MVSAPALDQLRFVKGHGTGNDFIIIFDPAGTINLPTDQIASICNRRFGLGADGILRVVPAALMAASKQHGVASPSLWFMDYRNADGSVAEMCGNGARVFAQYLVDAGLVTAVQVKDGFSIETRAGVHQIKISPNGVAVNMGPPGSNPHHEATTVPGAQTGATPKAVVSVGSKTWPASAWWLPNPHAVVFVDSLADAGSLATMPGVESAGLFPDGQNIEFVVDQSRSDTDLAATIRIYERGVGETLSCGTGACAVALALRELHAVTEPGVVKIEVPGGTLQVTVDSAGDIWLEGPTEFVAEGILTAQIGKMAAKVTD